MATITDKKKKTTKKVPAVNKDQQKAKSKTSSKLVPLPTYTAKEERQRARRVEKAKKELGWETKKEKEKKAKQEAKAAKKEAKASKKAEKKTESNLVPLKKYKPSKEEKRAAKNSAKVSKTASSGITSGTTASITPRTSLTENRYNASKPSNKLVPIPEYSASEQRQRNRRVKRAKKELGWD